jgi:HD-like signal output (HDOD) protein
MSETMLFVDDDANLLQGLQRMLRPKRNEWSMTFVTGSKEALKEMERVCFDVIVVDMRMPEIDGAELLQLVKKICPKSVRIILSGQAELPTILKAIGCTHQYLSKPCDPETLKNAIERASRLRKFIFNEDLEEFVSQLEALPSQKKHYHTVVEELKKESPVLEVIADAIAADLSMSAKVLQLVNSSFFGPKRAVYSVVDAVGILGVDLLRKLIADAPIFKCTEEDIVSGIDLVALNQCSVEKATRSCSGDNVCSPFEKSAYQFSSIGKLVLALFKPDIYAQVLAVGSSDESLILEKETALFGTTHKVVGAYLLALWGIPDLIVERVRG